MNSGSQLAGDSKVLAEVTAMFHTRHCPRIESNCHIVHVRRFYESPKRLLMCSPRVVLTSQGPMRDTNTARQVPVVYP